MSPEQEADQCFFVVVGFIGFIIMVVGWSGIDGNFSTPSTIDFTFTGNYTIVTTEDSQYQTYCHAITENFDKCTYLLNSINFDMASAINYSIDNCIVDETRDGSFDEKEHTCSDDPSRDIHYYMWSIVMWTGFSILFFPCGIAIIVMPLMMGYQWLEYKYYVWKHDTTTSNELTPHSSSFDDTKNVLNV